MEKDKLGISRFFSGYFKCFGKLAFVSTLFSVPTAAFVVLFWFLSSLTGSGMGFVSRLIPFLPIIFCSPFFAGLTAVTRNLARGDSDVRVAGVFLKAVRQNFAAFLLHGVLMCLSIFFCYTSIALYWNLAHKNAVFYFPFAITTIIAAAVMFVFFSVPVMTVTFDLKLRTIYKNSFLMSFGELKKHLTSALGLFLLFIFTASFYITIPLVPLRNAVVLAILVLIVPSAASYIINYNIFPAMARMISQEGAAVAGVRDESEAPEPEKYDFSALDLDEKKDGEEYLFFGGKMMKRKTLIAMRHAQEAENE